MTPFFWHFPVDSPLTSDKKGSHIRMTQSQLAGMHPCIQTCDPHIASLAMRLTFYQVIASIVDKADGATKLKTPHIGIKTDFHTATGQVGSWNIYNQLMYYYVYMEANSHSLSQSSQQHVNLWCELFVLTVAKWTHSHLLACHRDMAVPRCSILYSRSSEDVTVTDMTRNMSPISTCHQAANPSWEREMAQLQTGPCCPSRPSSDPLQL